MPILIVLLFSGLAAVASAGERLPSDVEKYVEQREGCEHFRGEIPDVSDKDRAKDIDRGIRRLCWGTDKKLAELKKKYIKRPAVLERLNEFEEEIE